MNTWFANISVKMKLALGFGVVLALTALLAVTGWSSVSKLIERSDDALNFAARADRGRQAGRSRRLNREAGGPVQIVAARQVGQRMCERDCKASRLPNRFDAGKAHDADVLRARCAWHVEDIDFV